MPEVGNIRQINAKPHGLSEQRAAMIKVAVVGTNGLAQYIVHYLATQTSHQFVILSRRVRVTIHLLRK